MSDLLAGSPHATPLTEAERQGLLLPVLTRGELNHAEAANIGRAMSWLFLTQARTRLTPAGVTDEEWLKRLHKRMYREVWAWAGEYRSADRNLGVPYWQVRIEMRTLLADTRAWLADSTATRYSEDECAIRFGYRLVSIQPFPNGNGRWSRLAADALAVALGRTRFTWGVRSLTEPGALRREYISALRAADSGSDFRPLLVFARK